MRDIKTVKIVPVITAGAYLAGDAVGGRLAVSNPFDGWGTCGKLTSITIVDKGNQKAPLQFHIFRDVFTAVADNAPYAVSDADLADKFIGVISIADAEYISNGVAQAVVTKQVNLPIAFPRNNGTLYMQLKTTGTPTYTSISDLAIILSFERGEGTLV